MNYLAGQSFCQKQKLRYRLLIRVVTFDIIVYLFKSLGENLLVKILSPISSYNLQHDLLGTYRYVEKRVMLAYKVFYFDFNFVSIIGPSSHWKTFFRQQDAFTYAKSKASVSFIVHVYYRCLFNSRFSLISRDHLRNGGGDWSSLLKPLTITERFFVISRDHFRNDGGN